ncbi:hypothetical protein VP01_549g1 [Puccinia sorghi]|uniref:Uncharacterized protein n=1 Tax=Puccinia sorghi TaxID=27349 RepID=A0A0L6UJI2_9BASI|nr:hypothetical protein VP01_549g1 [Puccinia sorghi]
MEECRGFCGTHIEKSLRPHCISFSFSSFNLIGFILHPTDPPIVSQVCSFLSPSLFSLVFLTPLHSLRLVAVVLCLGTLVILGTNHSSKRLVAVFLRSCALVILGINSLNSGSHTQNTYSPEPQNRPPLQEKALTRMYKGAEAGDNPPVGTPPASPRGGYMITTAWKTSGLRCFCAVIRKIGTQFALNQQNCFWQLNTQPTGIFGAGPGGLRKKFAVHKWGHGIQWLSLFFQKENTMNFGPFNFFSHTICQRKTIQKASCSTKNIIIGGIKHDQMHNYLINWFSKMHHSKNHGNACKEDQNPQKWNSKFDPQPPFAYHKLVSQPTRTSTTHLKRVGCVSNTLPFFLLSATCYGHRTVRGKHQNPVHQSVTCRIGLGQAVGKDRSVWIKWSGRNTWRPYFFCFNLYAVLKKNKTLRAEEQKHNTEKGNFLGSDLTRRKE